MATQAANIQDLVTTTLRELSRNKWTDNSSAYRKTVALKALINSCKTNMDSGYEVQWNRMTGVSNSARPVGLGAIDIVDITNQMGTCNVPWRHVTWNWAYDFREPLFNSGAAKIVDLIKTRRIAAMGGAVELFERMLWRAPAATDDVSIFGVPYWIVKSNTAATLANNNGFNGLSPATSITVGGVNPNTDDRWRNYASPYSVVSKDDFIRKARRMAEYTNFTPLVENTPQYDDGDKCEWYTNYAVSGTLVEILEGQNENLGSDIAPYEGQAKFMRAMINVIPELDNDTTNPFYQIDWGVFGIMGLKGAWMKETNVAQVAGQHSLSAVHTDCTLNSICYDRRKCGVLATDTTMPPNLWPIPFVELKMLKNSEKFLKMRNRAEDVLRTSRPDVEKNAHRSVGMGIFAEYDWMAQAIDKLTGGDPTKLNKLDLQLVGEPIEQAEAKSVAA